MVWKYTNTSTFESTYCSLDWDCSLDMKTTKLEMKFHRTELFHESHVKTYAQVRKQIVAKSCVGSLLHQNQIFKFICEL